MKNKFNLTGMTIWTAASWFWILVIGSYGCTDERNIEEFDDVVCETEDTRCGEGDEADVLYMCNLDGQWWPWVNCLAHEQVCVMEDDEAACQAPDTDTGSDSDTDGDTDLDAGSDAST